MNHYLGNHCKNSPQCRKIQIYKYPANKPIQNHHLRSCRVEGTKYKMYIFTFANISPYMNLRAKKVPFLLELYKGQEVIPVLWCHNLTSLWLEGCIFMNSWLVYDQIFWEALQASQNLIMWSTKFSSELFKNIAFFSYVYINIYMNTQKCTLA